MIDWPMPDDRNIDYVLQHSTMILPTLDNDHMIMELSVLMHFRPEMRIQLSYKAAFNENSETDGTAAIFRKAAK